MTATDAPVWERSLVAADVAATRRLAVHLGSRLRAGDLLILSGDLGAGKTTFTQGLGAGLGVRGSIISPTFVLVRIHPHPGTGPDLVHVDAYRLGSAAEIDDIDLENTLDSAVTVVEWGRGKVEHLSESRLEIDLHRAGGADLDPLEPGIAAPMAGTSGMGTQGMGAPGIDAPRMDFSESGNDGEPRRIRLRAFGPRWAAEPPELPVD